MLPEADVFAALGDETRLRLVDRLRRRGPLSITQLSHGLPLTRQAVTKHLRVMEEAGLVHGEKRGRETVWALSYPRLQEARDYLDVISHQWDEALERLRNLVED
ncbi:MAG TPA: metalloregulator ArsR/SmtB family transcription factor [Candidatus Xenobia bacterium]|jgi:DNA-binding transcriptional ArsR family regulator